MTTQTDRIRQMAQEAGLHINGHTSEERAAACARFARLVAEDFSEAYTEAVRNSPHISAADFIRARYSLKD